MDHERVDLLGIDFDGHSLHSLFVVVVPLVLVSDSRLPSLQAAWDTYACALYHHYPELGHSKLFSDGR